MRFHPYRPEVVGGATVAALLLAVTAGYWWGKETAFAQTRSVGLAWNPNPQSQGIWNYKVYWGNSSGNYGPPQVIAPTPSVILTGLPQTPVYIAVKATNVMGDSGYSNEVVSAPASTPTPTPSPTISPTPAPVLISGTVLLCTGGPVQGVTVGGGLTDAAGIYSFSVPSGTTINVVPFKQAVQPAMGGINSVDAIAVKQHFLGIRTLTGCAYAAADVTGDGVIDTADAIAIRQFFLNFPAGLVGNYVFMPQSIQYNNVTTNQTGQNYSTVVLGQVVP